MIGFPCALGCRGPLGRSGESEGGVQKRMRRAGDCGIFPWKGFLRYNPARRRGSAAGGGGVIHRRGRR